MSDLPASALAAPPPIASQPARRSALVSLGVVAATALSMLFVLGVLSRIAPRPSRPAFDAKAVKRFERRRPDVVLIGNSMVYTRFDARLLNELVKPTRVELLSSGGTQSAVWYAQLKNYVVRSRLPVRRVMIFFRDADLTLPALRTTGKFGGNLYRVMPAPDPVILRKIAPAATSPLDPLRHFLERLVPVERLRAAVSTRVDGWLVAASGTSSMPMRAAARKRAVNRLFRVEFLRGDVDEERSPWDVSRPFHTVVEASFLPDIVKLAHKHAIPLTFVRVRRRKVAAGRKDTPETRSYLRDLRRYVEEHGASYLDLSRDGWETIEMYGSTDHVDRRYKQKYTRLFVQHHSDLFGVRR